MDKIALHPEIMTFKDVARYLRVSDRHVQQMKYDGKIPFFTSGKIVRFRKSDIDKLFLNHAEA